MTAAQHPMAVSRFTRLARTQAAMAAGDAAMAVALADSVLFSIEPEAARGRVLLFLGISFVPFLFVAPLIGPFIDRLRGGRRFVIQLVALSRIVLSVFMAFHAEAEFAFFPLAFASLVMQKTYLICKSAIVPSVVRSEEELVEANSKLGLIAGFVGFVALLPAGALQKGIGSRATLLYAAFIFLLALLASRKLPKDVVAARRADRVEQQELHAPGVVLATTAMLLIRASVGFTFFHLFFWLRDREAGLVWFGLSLALASILTMVGNAVAPWLRHHAREETMLLGSLAVIAIAGLGTAALGGVISGVLLAAGVNLAAAIARLAVESIVQRDAPGSNRGRAFAQFETRFQLGWVAAGVIPVLIRMPGQLGFLLVGVLAAAGMLAYLFGRRAVVHDRVLPWPLGPGRRVHTPPRGVSRARPAPTTDPARRARPASEARRRP